MKRVVKWGFRSVLGVVLLSLFAGCGLLVAMVGLQAAGYGAQAERLGEEARATEEQFVKAKVVYDNLEQYLADVSGLERRKAEEGLPTAKGEVLEGLRRGPGAEVVEGPAAKGAVLLTLSKAGGAPALLELARAAEGARLVLSRAEWGGGRAELQAWLLPRVAAKTVPSVAKKGAYVPEPDLESQVSIFDFTGVARAREHLEHARRQVAAVDAAAPGVVELLEAFESEYRAVEGVLKLRDELSERGFRLDDFAKAGPALAMLDGGKLSSKGRRITLDGTLAEGKDPGGLRAALEGAFKVVEVSGGPVVHAVVERPAKAEEM